MTKPKNDVVRKVLQDSADGLTVKQIVELTQIDKDPLSRILATMPDAYIDRWQASQSRHKYVAVWCVVIPPANCPKPSE